MSREYNPILIGFSEQEGPIRISLQQARDRYGRMPSMYGFVTPKEGRDERKALNLKAGKFIRDALQNTTRNLKGDVYRYFKNWHRDYPAEFGIDVTPLININDPQRVISLVHENQAVFKNLLEMDLRAALLEKHLAKKEVLNSVPEARLPEKAAEMLVRKIRYLRADKKKDAIDLLNGIQGRDVVKRIEALISGGILEPDASVLACYADEISRLLLEIPEGTGFTGAKNLKGITGKGVEFEYAQRDASYFMLGKDTGDCTADKKSFQADNDIENIFWTVFSWILDQNYQVLKVYFNGEFVLKVHLLPLYIPDAALLGNSAFLPGKSDYMMLAVDAVETIRGLRDDLPGCRQDLVDQRAFIFEKTIAQVEEIARQMKIRHIYAERFSNTPWIRDYYQRYPEIFLHVNHMEKIDHLEDVFYLARELCESAGKEMPEELFMEIQMKNTYLIPKLSKASGVKSYTVIKGDPADGIPKKMVIGV